MSGVKNGLKPYMNMRGFTLPEMLAVITILGILLGIGMFEYKNFRERYQIESQTKELYIDLMNARVRAMQRNRMHFFVLEHLPGATRYTLYEDTNPSPDGDEIKDAADVMIMQKTQESPHDLTWDISSTTSIDREGLVTLATLTGAIYASKQTATEYDCVMISTTRINMGKRNGSTCTDK